MSPVTRRLTMRWASARAAASLRAEGRHGPQELQVELSAPIRLGLALAEERGLTEAQRRSLTERILSQPGVRALLQVADAEPWSGALVLWSEGDPGVERALWRCECRWDGRAWEVRGVGPPGRLQDGLAWLGEQGRAALRGMTGAALLVGAMIVAPSWQFWTVAERFGALVALPLAREPAESAEPSIGLLLVEPSAPSPDRAPLTRALDDCLAAGARVVLLDVALDVREGERPPLNLEMLTQSLARHAAQKDRVIVGYGEQLGEPYPWAMGEEVYLGVSPSQHRGRGAMLSVELDQHLEGREGSLDRTLPSASWILAREIAATSLPPSPAGWGAIPVFRHMRGGGQWLPFAMSNEEAWGEPTWLKVRRQSDDRWAEACDAARAATILALNDPKDHKRVASVLGTWGPEAVFGPRRIAALTRQLLARSSGTYEGLRFWDLEVALALSGTPSASDTGSAPLARHEVSAPGPACWLAAGLWFTPWLLLRRALCARAQRDPTRLLQLAQIAACLGLFWVYTLYLPMVATTLVLSGAARWSRRET